MLDSVTINDANGNAVSLHESSTRSLRRADGLVGVPGTRDSVRPWPNAHGSIDESRWMTDRVITLEGEIWGSTYEQVFDEFGLINKAFLESLTEGPSTLKWTRGGAGTALQAEVKLAGPVQTSIAEGGKFLRYQALLRAPDPRAYSQTQTTGTGGSLSTAAGGLVFPDPFAWTFSASGGGSVSVNNTGDIPTPAIFRIYGSVTTPQIRLVETGETIALTGSVGAGDYLEVNVAERTVSLNGTTSRLNLLDYANTTWFELPVGTSTIRLLAGTFDGSARVDAIYRPAFI